MGRYMTVVLKEKYRNDMFIQLLNEELAVTYGANTGDKFNTWEYVRQEADYMNTHKEGLKQLPHFKRPITVEVLHRNFFWYRLGEFSFKLSCCPDSDSARDAIAVSKWLLATKCKYIDKEASDNYETTIVAEYLNHLFEEAGYDLIALWKPIYLQH